MIKKYPEAIENYKLVLQTNPNDQYSLADLGFAYENSNNIEAAITQYKKALSVNSNFDQVQLNLARLYTNQKNYEDALIEYKKYSNI